MYLFQASKIPPIYERPTTSNISVEEGGHNVSSSDQRESWEDLEFSRTIGYSPRDANLSGIKIMQPSAAAVICYSWREIAATGRCHLDEGGHNTSLKPNHGVRIFEGALGIPAQKDKFFYERRGHHGRLGGGLSGSEQLVHGHVPSSMRFSYRWIDYV